MEDGEDTAASPGQSPNAIPVRLVGFEEVPVHFANEAYVVADPLALHLVFTRFAPRSMFDVTERQKMEEQGFIPADVVGRLIIPPLLAQRMIKLLEEGLTRYHQFSQDYAAMIDGDEGVIGDGG